MPHLILTHTPNLAEDIAFTPLCRALADVMVAARDEAGALVFPTGGVRVMAIAAAHFAVSDGTRADDAFLYLNLRMKAGRSAATHKLVSDALMQVVKEHTALAFKRRTLGVTLQIDEGQEVYDAKLSTIHPLYSKQM